MPDLFSFILNAIADFFAPLYSADRRPEARKMTVQLFIIVTVIALVLFLLFRYTLTS